MQAGRFGPRRGGMLGAKRRGRGASRCVFGGRVGRKESSRGGSGLIRAGSGAEQGVYAQADGDIAGYVDPTAAAVLVVADKETA